MINRFLIPLIIVLALAASIVAACGCQHDCTYYDPGYGGYYGGSHTHIHLHYHYHSYRSFRRR